ncbi:MAG: hypothetical protein ACJ76H_00655 [Bacteriovoracaceae bacterium]
MKSFFALIVLGVSLNGFAGTVKTCNTLLSLPEETPIPSRFEVIETNGILKAVVTQKIEGQTNSYEDTATVGDYSVREGLSENTEPEGLNKAEALVVHAMTLENDPVFEGRIKSGVDLKKVRGAKVYTIGEVTNMGGTAIVEARDSKGKALGSYLGGFLISPCK